MEIIDRVTELTARRARHEGTSSFTIKLYVLSLREADRCVSKDGWPYNVGSILGLNAGVQISPADGVLSVDPPRA